MEEESAQAGQPRVKKPLLLKCLAQVSPFQACGLFFATLGCILGHLARDSQPWQIWEVDNIPGIHQVTIGLWKVCYLRLLPEGKYNQIRCEEYIRLKEFLPREIIMAQLYSISSDLLQALSVGFLIFSFWIASVRQRKKLELFLTKMAVFFHVASAIVTLIPISFNVSFVWRHKLIDFPKSLDLPHFPSAQNLGAGIYLGFISVTFQILGGELILWEKWRRSKEIPSMTSVTVEPQPFQDFSSLHVSVSSLSWRNSSLTSASESPLPSSSPEESSPSHLSSLPLSLPIQSHCQISPSRGSPLRLHLLSFSSSSSPSPSPSRSLSVSPARPTNLSLHSLFPKDFPSPPPSPSFSLPQLTPSSPTLTDFQISPSSGSPLPLHPLCFPSSPPTRSSHLSPGVSPSKTDKLRVSAPIPTQLPSSPTRCSPIPLPNHMASLPTQRGFSTPLPSDLPRGLPTVDI